jgi:hypothetical protein
MNPFTQEQKKIIENEFEQYGIQFHLQRDVTLWTETLRTTQATTPLEQQRIDIISRIFTVLRYGGLLYRNNKESDHCWRYWSETKRPLASVLSHGSRVLIQLPKVRSTVKQHKASLVQLIQKQISDYNEESDYDHTFWRWLLTGRMQGEIDDVVSTSNSGDEAKQEGRVVFKRLAATHSIEYWDASRGTTSTDCHKSPKKIVLPPIGNQVEKYRYIYEIKDVGINPRNTKLNFGSSRSSILYHHRHFGMNVSIGGYGNEWNNQRIESNGEFGHLYLYYMSPAVHRHGGIMIGVEGSEFGKVDRGGTMHTIAAKSSPVSITQGLKWDKYKALGVQDVPDKYDSMFVDLSTSWSFLRTCHWDLSYLAQTTENR